MKSILITTGDPAGCGPIITLQAINKLRKKNINFIVVGDYKILKRLPLYSRLSKKINLIDANTKNIEKIKMGYASKLSGEATLNYLNISLKTIMTEKIKRLVTAPLSKEAIKFIYPNFLGQTEYLAKYFKVKKFEMMMVSKKIKLILFTRHQPLRTVSSLITTNNLENTIKLTYRFLRKLFKIKNPKIAIASFNPHASIETYLEKEEEIIVLAIKKSKKNIYGPFPSDTLFLEQNLNKYDCIICLYHDQAMLPFKLLSFRTGVNLTLGLPIIRTSPAHGVAYDIIRHNRIPLYSSMLEAIKLALTLPV